MLTKDKKWYRVTLRLMGDKLPIDEIESQLNLVASKIGRKGKHISDNPRYGKYRTNIWCSQYLTSSDVPFEEQITILLNKLEPRTAQLEAILVLPKIKAELFLGFGSGNGQGGATFSPELLMRIVKFNLTISLDLYPPAFEKDEG